MGYRVSELWAWIATDEKGDEVVLSRHEAGVKIPMVGRSQVALDLQAGEAARVAGLGGLESPRQVRFVRQKGER